MNGVISSSCSSNEPKSGIELKDVSSSIGCFGDKERSRELSRGPSIGKPRGGRIFVNCEEGIWNSSTRIGHGLEGIASSIARGLQGIVWVSFNREVKVTALSWNSNLVESFFTFSSTIFVVPVVFVSCRFSIVRNGEVSEAIVGRVSLRSESGHLYGENTLGICSSWVN